MPSATCTCVTLAMSMAAFSLFAPFAFVRRSFVSCCLVSTDELYPTEIYLSTIIMCVDDIAISHDLLKVYSVIPRGYAVAVSSPLRFPANIGSLRKALVPKVSQTQLGAIVGVEQPAVSDWENGKSFPNAGDLPKIARVLGVSLDLLLQGLDAQYDAARDLLGQGKEVQRSPRHKGDAVDPASAHRIADLQRRLEQIDEQRIAERKEHEDLAAALRDVAGRLLNLAAGDKGKTAANPASKTRGRDRKTG